MNAYYEIQISFTPSIDIYNSITQILEVKPVDDLKTFPNNEPHTWTYLIEDKEEKSFDFIEILLNILENKYDKLLDLGINKKDISIWYLYEYDQQCNMEFLPKNLKRLGENEITFCVSCWKSESTIHL